MEVEIISKISKYTEVKIEQLITDQNQRRPVGTIAKNKYTGFIPIVLKLFSESKQCNENNCNEHEIYQWLEFVSSYICSSNILEGKVVLKTLNAHLENYSYLIGYSRTLADIIMYYCLRDLLASLTPSEKETFVHVCRWFNHIQFDDKIRQDEKAVDFSTNYNCNQITA